ncbi:MAG: hypothetical protein C0467_28420 [Planctomycetaceae bacterium]|nr:hypothetical protein [Planctomycetaceae bacterium]
MRHLTFAVAVSVIATLGCGDRGGRSVIEGRVTWEGKPVPAGQVVFEPDPDRGGKGPAGVATIQDGHFRTNPEFGAVAGPHIARFRFGDGKGVNDMQPFGRPICPEFTETVDLGGKATTINFELPLKK